jgi:hypothetical protein
MVVRSVARIKKEPGTVFPRCRAYTWRRPTLTGPIVPLPSALRRFTSGFGMGPGGSTTLWSPEGNPACGAGTLGTWSWFTSSLAYWFIGRKFPRGACSLPVNQSTNQPMTAGFRPPARSLASTWRSGLFFRLGAGDGGHLAVLGLLPNSKRGIKTAG